MNFFQSGSISGAHSGSGLNGSAGLREIRLSLGGAILGVSASGIISAFWDFDRGVPDLFGGMAGFAIALAYQRAARAP